MASLEELRAKVEAGERLTAEEFDALDRAARASTGPSLRLSVAHALLNAGEERQGLSLLEALARDFPRDVQVHLGHARALIGLERYSDAERSLKTALAVNPGDPEALKAMAVLALRRNETRRAREWISEVLQRDPFDAEARLLKEELEAAELPAPALSPTALRPEYARALVAALDARGISHVARANDVIVRLADGEVARLDLASHYAAYLAEGGPLDAAVAKVADELSGMKSAMSLETLHTRVLPVLRDPSFIATASTSLHREGPAGLCVFYVLDDPELVRYVPRAAVGGFLSMESLDEAAWANLEKKPAPLERVQIDRGKILRAEHDTGLWAIAGGDGSDSARLLMKSSFDAVLRGIGDGPWRVNLGRRELALICRNRDEACVQLLDALGVSDGIAGRFRLTDGGVLERL